MVNVGGYPSFKEASRRKGFMLKPYSHYEKNPKKFHLLSLEVSR